MLLRVILTPKSKEPFEPNLAAWVFLKEVGAFEIHTFEADWWFLNTPRHTQLSISF